MLAWIRRGLTKIVPARLQPKALQAILPHAGVESTTDHYVILEK
jgi:hypothetical protein